jgi:hypothetical protein
MDLPVPCVYEPVTCVNSAECGRGWDADLAAAAEGAGATILEDSSPVHAMDFNSPAHCFQVSLTFSSSICSKLHVRCQAALAFIHCQAALPLMQYPICLSYDPLPTLPFLSGPAIALLYLSDLCLLILTSTQHVLSWPSVHSTRESGLHLCSLPG